jgi:hypothetical protein
MSKKPALKVDKVRASRDGHEFHISWAVRKSLQLVVQRDELVGIAVEGLEPGDQTRASAETIEIADLVLYHGQSPGFTTARATTVIQLKYSVGSESKPFRASDAKKTIKKFADAYRDHKRNYGAQAVEEKLSFELVTNRPILPELVEALQALASGATTNGTIRAQANQLEAACRLGKSALPSFSRKVSFVGLAGSLIRNQQLTIRQLADWSPARDSNARIAMQHLSAMLRKKAGSIALGRNVATQIDVLDALGLQSPEDLLPVKMSFVVVEPVVPREQVRVLVDRIPCLEKPLLVHAAGGLGKTVFLQSLADQLARTHKCVLFDCFGGGAYRAPDDSRHQPKRGIVHIANQLAVEGLCDPILPLLASDDEYIRTFRVRLNQAAETLRRAENGPKLILLLDAADNAAVHAHDCRERAFPTLLLASFAHLGAPDGVKLVVSCRTERRPAVLGPTPSSAVDQQELWPFTKQESDSFVKARVPTATETELQVAYARSGGNPRILEHLVRERRLLEDSEVDRKIEVDCLIAARIETALSGARKRGHTDQKLNAFLAGLAVLPPPVPIPECAEAHGLDKSEVESFAADLSPLLERTRSGLIFRDEPTETLVRETYVKNTSVINTLVENLLRRQSESVYAAGALPGLLQKLNHGARLFELAFDDRFPAASTAVGKLKLRYARLKAAVGHAAKTEEYDHLVRLLVELSTLAATNERGTAYILEHPDLVVASRDLEAERRLSEIRTVWPGTRHACMAIVNVLNGFADEASRHLEQASAWTRHFHAQDDDYRRERGGPTSLDIAAEPLCFVALGRTADAARSFESWKDWYAFEMFGVLMKLLSQAQSVGVVSEVAVGLFVSAVRSTGALAGVLAFHDLDEQSCRNTVMALANSRVGKAGKAFVELNLSYQGNGGRRLEDGLLKAAVLAIQSNSIAEANAILSIVTTERPQLWSFFQPLSGLEVYRYLVSVAVRAHAQNRAIDYGLVLPRELVALRERIGLAATEADFRQELRAQLDAAKVERGLPNAGSSLSTADIVQAERFVDERLGALVKLTECLTRVLCSPRGGADGAFRELVKLWEKPTEPSEAHDYRNASALFWRQLGRQLLSFSMWARSDLGAASVRACVDRVAVEPVEPAWFLIEMAEVLGRNPSNREAAGRLARVAEGAVAQEDDVAAKATSYAELARALLPASIDEATTYFQLGLKGVDAIGSGDIDFVNELLVFAGRTSGGDLTESDIHTLANICELNMPSEEEKFPWPDFAAAMSRLAGCRVLARLGRWTHREKISLDHTLLPLLVALVGDARLHPAIALGLLRLARPAESHRVGIPDLAAALERRASDMTSGWLRELLNQYRRDRPRVVMPSSIARLAEIASRVLGGTARETQHLVAAVPWYRSVVDEGNELRNAPSTHTSDAQESRHRDDQDAMDALANSTDPLDEASLSRAVGILCSNSFAYELKGRLFGLLRGKVAFPKRGEYLRLFARLEGLQLGWKLDEFRECRAAWGAASISLGQVLRELAPVLVRLHVGDLVSFGRLWSSSLQELSEVTGVEVRRLSLDLAAYFAEPDNHAPSSVWIGLAGELCGQATAGKGREALARLLRTEPARLASAVVDGEWKAGLYPEDEPVEVAAGLVWLCLGSPSAEERWRAAHSVRSFARLEAWEVVDALVALIPREDALPFQAPELPFFFLHARLWLLIALARIAKDCPKRIASYVSTLRFLVLGREMPHVLMRHFAARALAECVDAGVLELEADELRQLHCVNQSPWALQKVAASRRETFYDGRPKGLPEPAQAFYLDYDFAKSDVEAVSRCFGRPHWETQDEISARVHLWAPTVRSMYDPRSGPTVTRRSGYAGVHRENHGEQLGWHALMVVAGDYLAKHPVIRLPHESANPWEEWLGRELLTRSDGLWLADGLDDTPLEIQVNLCEREGESNSVGITGDRARLLALVGLCDGAEVILRELVVGGHWTSVDEIGVHVTSALVPAGHGTELAIKAAARDGFDASLPVMECEDQRVYADRDDAPFEPWTIWPEQEVGLDGTDPLGARSVAGRIRFSREVVALCGIAPGDPFGREWRRADGAICARSEAWGSGGRHRTADSAGGNRLVCCGELLREILAGRETELVVLVRLRRYEAHADKRPEFWHTTAAILVRPDLTLDFYKGLVNEVKR